MSRWSGTVSAATHLGPDAHVGWAYRDRSELRARAAEFIADGLAADQRTVYVADGPRRYLDQEVAVLAGDGFDPARVGTAELGSFYRFVGRSDVIDPVASLEEFTAAVGRATAAGHAGARAIVDATPLVRSPLQLDAFARYEQLLDRAMVTLPVAALCTFDIGALGAAVAGQLTCLHPLADRRSTAFRLFAVGADALGLAGTIGPAETAAFEAALSRALAAAPATTVTVDASRLDAIDVPALEVMDRCGRKRRRTVELTRLAPAVVPGTADLAHLRLVRA